MTNPVFPSIPVLLVDGDIVAYRCAAVAEKTKYLSENPDGTYKVFDTAKEAKAYVDPQGYTWSRKELQPAEFAIDACQSTMHMIATKFPESLVQVYLSGERNFRDNLWVTKKYKGNREQPKPTHLPKVREYLLGRWFAVVSQNQEADDDIGIANRNDTVIVSVDKDLDQLPGWHWNWVKEELYYVTSKDADQFLYEQVISGDSTDNIPGLPGWGPVKARQYLDARGEQSLYEATVALFLREGYDYSYFNEMKSLVGILREPR